MLVNSLQELLTDFQIEPSWLILTYHHPLGKTLSISPAFLRFSNSKMAAITGMAPICDWMIKIVKVNKLYLNSLPVTIVNRVSRSGTMRQQRENADRCLHLHCYFIFYCVYHPITGRSHSCI